MRAVNLLPADRQKGAKGAKGSGGPKLSKLHGIGLGALLVAGALGYWGHGIQGQASQKKAEADDLEARVTTLTTQIAAQKAKAEVKPAAVSTFAADRTLVIGLAQARVNWSNVIINLSRVAPASVWLDTIKVTTPTGTDSTTTGAALPTAITLSGKALSRTAAVQFISRLDAIPGFEEPVLKGGINPDESENGPTVYTFQLEIPINDGVFGPVKPKSATAATTPTTPAATPSTTTPANQ